MDGGGTGESSIEGGGGGGMEEAGSGGGLGLLESRGLRVLEATALPAPLSRDCDIG